MLTALWVDEFAVFRVFNTAKSRMEDVRVVYRWADDSGIDHHHSWTCSLHGLSRKKIVLIQSIG